MIFTSIKEYFYKLYNICYILVLIPLALFLFLYYQAQVEKILPVIDDQDVLIGIVWGVISLAVIGLTTVHLFAGRRLKLIAREAGLGAKMDQYYLVAILRICLGSAASFLMNLGFYLTGSIWFALAFGVTMAWLWWQWPTPKRFCNDLAVRNDERELLLKSKDSF